MISGEREADAEQSVSRIGARLADSSSIPLRTSCVQRVIIVATSIGIPIPIRQTEIPSFPIRRGIYTYQSRFGSPFHVASLPDKSRIKQRTSVVPDLTLRSVIFRMHVYDARPSRVRHVSLARQSSAELKKNWIDPNLLDTRMPRLLIHLREFGYFLPETRPPRSVIKK